VSAKKILLITAVALLGLVGVFMIYAIMVAPARQPYRSALTQFNRVNDGNADLTTAGSLLGSSKATGEQFEKNIKMAQTVLNNLRIEQTALAKESVLQNGEGKALFVAFDDKMQAYMTYTENVLTSMQKVRPAIFDCTTAMSNTSADAAGVAAVRKCSTDLSNLKDVPDADYQQLVATFSEKYAELATVLEKQATLQSPKGADAAQNTALESERDQILKDISTAGTTFSADSKRHHAAIVSSDTAQNLKDYLEAKSRVIQFNS